MRALRISGLILYLGLNGAVVAGTFADPLTSATIDSTVWTAWQSSPGLYSIAPGSGGVTITKVGTNPGGQQNGGLYLNFAALGLGAISGDFDATIHFSGATVFGPGLDQVEFHTDYSSGMYYLIRDDSNVHAWVGGAAGNFSTSASEGTFEIRRVGGAVTGYFEGNFIYQAAIGSSFTGLNFILQNNQGSNDPTSVTFSNFSITADSIVVPEPGCAALLAGALAGCAALRKKASGKGPDTRYARVISAALKDGNTRDRLAGRS